MSTCWEVVSARDKNREGGRGREGGKMCGRGSFHRAFRDALRWGLLGTLKVMGVVEPVLSRVREKAEPKQMWRQAEEPGTRAQELWGGQEVRSHRPVRGGWSSAV